MSMDEYLAVLTGQIRSPKAKAMVEREIKDHIEDQTQAYESSGLNHEEAAARAVVQMGDPVTVGVELDRIHRPRAGWSFLLWIMLLSIVGLLVQYFCYYRIGPVSGYQHYYAGSESAFFRQCFFTLTGLMIMGIIYFVDYSILGKLSKFLGFLFLGGLWFICALMLGVETVRNLMNNFGYYTMSTGGLLFFSYGRFHTIAVYALLGVLLSIYRHQDLIWEKMQEKKSQADGILFEIGRYRLRIERR